MERGPVDAAGAAFSCRHVNALAEQVVELAAIPAPTFDEEARLAWLEQRLQQAAGERYRDAAGNLIWRWGTGAPRVLLLAHVDTVFGPDAPARFVEQGDRLVGPGVGDNAAAVIVTIEAVARLLEHGDVEPAAVAFTVCEEGLGNLKGARVACEALRPELAIAIEGQGLERIVVDAIGSLRARLLLRGPGGHSWSDRGLPSAVHALLRLGSSLVELGTPETPVNVGLVSGGRSINAIADQAELTVELRSLDEADLEAFGEQLAALSVDAPLELTLELVGRRPAGRIAPDHPLVATARRARAALGLPDELGQSSTDANAALALGIPAITLGATRGGGMHSLTEWIEPATLELGLAQLSAVLDALLRPTDRGG